MSGRFVLAKSLQLVGLFVLPIALIIGMTEPDSMYRELTLLAVGAALFIVGRRLEPRE